VSDKLLETMPLRDRIREAERLSRELAEHLDLDFCKKIHAVRAFTRREGHGGEAVADHTVRASVDAALSSHEYTIELIRRLDLLLDSINREAGSVVGTGVAGTA
jgi:hypothetical protein